MPHPIEQIKFGVIPVVNYRGCLLEKIIGGFRILGSIVSTPEEVDEVIDQAHEKLSKTVVNNHDGSMNCQNHTPDV